MQFELDFGLATITSPSVYGRILNGPTLVAEYSLPFSWTNSINLDSISQNLCSSQQLVKWTKPSKLRLDAIFHSRFQSIVDTTYESHDTIIPLYAIASLVNNVSSVDPSNPNDAYALLKALPLRDISQSLKALPAPILDTLKERVFATAVRVGDIDMVSTMLELNMDASEQIMMEWPSESKPTYPLQFAVAAGHLAIAKALSEYMCRGASQSQLEQIIDYMVEGDKLRHLHFPRDSAKLSGSERMELMCIALRAGARPHRGYLETVHGNVSMTSLKQLLEASTAGIVTWLEAGLLERYFTPRRYEGPLSADELSLAGDVLQFVLFNEHHHLPKNDPRLKTAILGALYSAIRPHHERSVEMILEAFSFLGYHLDDGDAYVGDFSAHDFMDRPILEAFDDTDWTLAASLMIAKGSIANSGKADPIDEQRSQLEHAIQKNDPTLAFGLYTLTISEHIIELFGQRMVELAISHSDSAMAITIIEDMSHWSTTGLTVLLSHSQIMAVSTLLGRNPTWSSALEAASGHKDFAPLETILFHCLRVPFMIFEGRTHAILDPHELQLGFRTVAYYCMATNDYKLCQWLLQVGMDPEEFYADFEEGTNIRKGSGLHCSLPGGIGTEYYGSSPLLPSLLAVAAQRNDIDWMKFLAAEGVSVIDSMALSQAIKSRATVATVRFLLDAAKVEKSSVKRSYGVAALRQAIRYRDINRIDILCSVVNIDEIEPFNEEFVKIEPAVSPLGEAIIAKDSEIVQVLLKLGASPNAYVSFDGLKMLRHIKSHIQRVTPLLAAIDVQSLALVKMLVEHRAELQYTRNMGITRTPLQRAAETGCFDIVEYLVGQGAIIDTFPVYSGGTALQLAAMSGFCGIAAFLLERGADPNYPPAKGDGRTAFEAAAEWGSVDTMSLLMQWNADLDAQFGEPPESQYERARRFAEKNGFMASKRFVEHLYGQRMGEENGLRAWR